MATNVDEYGYDVNFVSEVPDELKCVICHLVLREPIQIMTCGHRLCKLCFDRMNIHAQQMSIDLQCPVDREVISLGEVYPDRAASRTIGNLKVQCGNVDRGCPWVDDLRELNDHEAVCEFNSVDLIKDLSLVDEQYDELKSILKEVMSRLQRCEEDLMTKDKDLLNLKYTVSELKEDKRLKDEEVRLLKLSNDDLKAESIAQKDETVALKKSILDLQKELDSMKHSSEGHRQKINDLHSKDVLMKQEIEGLKENSIQNQIPSIQEEIKTTKEHIENIESVLFAHKHLVERNEVTLDWVMQDYLHMYRIGKRVLSPIFDTKIGGYSFQLFVLWQKETLNMHLQLHRGKTPHKFLDDFNKEFTMTIYGKNGVKKVSTRYTQIDIARNKQSFLIRKGEDTPEQAAGFQMLTAPFDDFIINNSLILSVTFHL